MITVTDTLVTRAMNMSRLLLGRNMGSITEHQDGVKLGLFGLELGTILNFCDHKEEFTNDFPFEIDSQNYNQVCSDIFNYSEYWYPLLKKSLVEHQGLLSQRRYATEVMRVAIETGVCNDLDSDTCLLALFDLHLQGIHIENIKLDEKKFINLITKLFVSFPDVKQSWNLERFYIYDLDEKIIRLFLSVEDHLHKREVVERLGAICFNQGIIRGQFYKNVRGL